MESNAQTELTREMGTDSQMESRMTASSREVRERRDQTKRDKDPWRWTPVW